MSKSKQTPFRVEATAVGVYGNYRNPGDQFEISGKDAFSEIWMKKLDGKKSAPKEAPAGKSVDPDDEQVDDGNAPTHVGDANDLDVMDDDALIKYAKANCPGLKISRTMKDATIREHIREYQDRQGQA